MVVTVLVAVLEWLDVTLVVADVVALVLVVVVDVEVNDELLVVVVDDVNVVDELEVVVEVLN